MYKMNKKADFSLETLAKLLVAVVVLFILLAMIWLSKDKILSLITKIADIFRFG